MMNYKELILETLGKIERPGMDKVIEFLKESDYFTAPASTKYHGNYPGALAEHSWNVRELFHEKNKKYNLGVPEESVDIAALLHDFCKIGFYYTETKWAKDGSGAWKSYEEYAWKDDFPVGHGERSVIQIMKLMQLTDLEIMLIRWHMGLTDEFCNTRAYYNAVGKYPAIVAIHTSDYEASTFLEKTLPSKKIEIENSNKKR
jgi:hypothetical protein